jgi:hypothetical protein
MVSHFWDFFIFSLFEVVHWVPLFSVMLREGRVSAYCDCAQHRLRRST